MEKVPRGGNGDDHNQSREVSVRGGGCVRVCVGVDGWECGVRVQVLERGGVCMCVGRDLKF